MKAAFSVALLVSAILAGYVLVQARETRSKAGDEFRDLNWSPDGRQIAVSIRHSGAGPFGLAVVSVPDGELRDVIADGVQPVWSPSGDKIAFFRQESEYSDLWYLETHSLSVNRLRTGTFWMDIAAGYEWDGGGNSLRFFRGYRPKETCEVTLGGRVECSGTDLSGWFLTSFAWNRTRTTLALSGHPPGGTPRLFLASSSGRQPTAVTNRIEPGHWEQWPAWSHASDGLLYTASRAGRGPSIRSVRSDGSLDRELIAAGLKGQFSPNGKWIAYLASYEVGFFSKALCLAASDGSGPRSLIRQDAVSDPCEKKK